MGKTENLVSVIMATYNREDYLPFAIDSVLQQTYANLEILVVDDGSTDATRKLVASYADDRIKYFYQDNTGQSGAINIGLAHVRGDYVCFIDSDNVWKLDKLEKQIKLMIDNPGYEIIYGENEIIDENGFLQPAPPPVRRHTGEIMEKLLVFNFVTFNTVMIRSKCFDELGGMDAQVPAGPDYDLFLKFSTRYRFLYVNDIFAQYRIMKNQMSSNKDRRFRVNKQILEKFIDQYRSRLTSKTVRYVWCRFYTNKGRYQASIGRLKAALSDYFTAMTYQPFSIHPWRALAKLLIQRR